MVVIFQLVTNGTDDDGTVIDDFIQSHIACVSKSDHEFTNERTAPTLRQANSDDLKKPIPSLMAYSERSGMSRSPVVLSSSR